ncbi:MAG TPA: LptA/OstA family protein [Micavibrio sp.]
MNKILVFVILGLLLGPAAFAQEPADKASPIEITADKTLEWHRKSSQYVANGNVVVKQGGVAIHADSIAADYHDEKGSGFSIYRLTAAGHVAIDSQGGTAVGDKLVYAVDSGLAVMTGSQLKMTSPDQTVTATDRFEYSVRDGKLKAFGNATVIRGQDRLQADTIAAALKEDAQGNRRLDRMSADGHVKITTPTEILTGEKGSYAADSNIAEISGGVKILRGQSDLSGDRANINLTTGISTMFGSPAEGGRVRGTFYPGQGG